MTRAGDARGSRCPNLAAWPGLELRSPLTGGARNVVYRADRRGEQFVVRRSGRSQAALEWELDLIATVASAGVRAPTVVATADGRRHDHGIVVHRFIDGVPPRSRRDWLQTVIALGVVHEATASWPQRPGFASARDLMSQRRGGDVDLDAMPTTAVDAVRASWRPVLDGPQCVIHGDLGQGNVLVAEDDVALIDWDEARVDVPAFDFAHLPENIPVPGQWGRDTLVTAGVAWETATCWIAEPDYAARRLAELQARIR